MFNLSLKNLSIPFVDQMALKKALEESLKLISLKADYIQQQLFPSTANDTYLLTHAAIRGLQRKEAFASSGKIRFSSPLSLEKDTRLLAEDGREYRLTEKINNTIDAPIESLEAGLSQNLNPGATLRLLAPAGFVSEGKVLEPGLIGGTDQESLESLRQRIIEKWQSKAEYGTDANYYSWLGESQVRKPGIFPNFPLPGMVMWSGLVDGPGNTLLTPPIDIQKSVTALLDARRPPSAKVFYQVLAKITLIKLSIKTQVSISTDQKTTLNKLLNDLFVQESFPKGASGFEEKLPISENMVRLTIYQFLGDSNPFELRIEPTGKLGSPNLGTAEYLLLGEVAYQ